MGSTFAMSARQKYSSDARFATGLYSSDVLFTSIDVTSASCMRMLTSFDLCIDAVRIASNSTKKPSTAS